jgi:aquaporin Z
MSSQTQTVVPAPADASPPAKTEASLAARLGAEAFGTFALVLAIVGVALYNSFSNGSYVFPVALAAGLGVTAAIAAVGHVSGGHFNPAVTLGMTIAGRAKWRDLVPYWAAQVIGGWLAAGALYLTIPSTLGTALKKSSHEIFAGTANGFGTHSPLDSISQGSAHFSSTAALIIEIAATAVFVGIVIGVTDKRANVHFAPIAIGFGLATAIIVAGPITNASINPARSTASAIFSPGGIHNIFTGTGIAGQLWFFWVAPLVGGAIAALFYLAFAAPRANRPEAVVAVETSTVAAVETAEAKAEQAFSELKDKVATDEVADLSAAAGPAEPGDAAAIPASTDEAAATDEVVSTDEAGTDKPADGAKPDETK